MSALPGRSPLRPSLAFLLRSGYEKYLCIHQYAERYSPASGPVNSGQNAGAGRSGFALASGRRGDRLRMVVRVPQGHARERDRVAAADEVGQGLLEGILGRVVERVADADLFRAAVFERMRDVILDGAADGFPERHEVGKTEVGPNPLAVQQLVVSRRRTGLAHVLKVAPATPEVPGQARGTRIVHQLDLGAHGRCDGRGAFGVRRRDQVSDVVGLARRDDRLA